MACSKLYPKLFQFVLKFHVNNLHRVGVCVCAQFCFFSPERTPTISLEKQLSFLYLAWSFPNKWSGVVVFFFFAASFSLSWVPVLKQFSQILMPKYLEAAPWSIKNGSPKPQWIYWKLWSAMQSFQLNITGSWPWNGKSQSSFGNDTLWPAVCCSTLSLINDQKWWLKQASKREYFA